MNAVAEAPKGHSRHSGFERDELDWYVEPAFVVEQLFDHEDFSGHFIWDPSCGRGNILDVCAARGMEAFGSDVVARDGVEQRHAWAPCDFLAPASRFVRPIMRRAAPKLAIVNNPPYGRLEPNMPRGDTFAERFARRALAIGADKVAMIVNGKFLWSARRGHGMFVDHPPTQLLFCSERPSMPPGHELPRLIAEGRAYEGGAIDYVWLLWIEGAPPRPPAWLKSPAPAAPLLGVQA